MNQDDSRAEAFEPDTSSSVSNKNPLSARRKSHKQKMEQPDAKASIHSILADLECSICLELFLSPYSLPCGHIFCGPCLSGWFSVQKSDRGKCPECRKSTVYPGAGLDGLIPAYKLETVIVAVEKFLPKNQIKLREERRTEWVLLKEALSEKKRPKKPATLAPTPIGPSHPNATFGHPVFAPRPGSSPAPWIPFPEPHNPPLPISTSSTFPNTRSSMHAPHRLAASIQSQTHVISTSSSTPTNMAQANAVPTNANGGFAFEHSTLSFINFGYHQVDQLHHFSPTLQQQQQQQHNVIPNIFNQPPNASAETPAWWRHPARVWSFDPSRGLWV